MATNSKSRWADDEEDAVHEARKKQEREAKRKAKAEKQQKLESQQNHTEVTNGPEDTEDSAPLVKRQKVSTEANSENEVTTLRFPTRTWKACRHVDEFEKLNHIEEGSYGWVSRAREISTGEVVALKKLKMADSPEGFPVTGLREIQTLMESQHPNIVNLREVVMGDTMNELDSVFLVMDFLEHDLKTLQDEMTEGFSPSEIKTLMLQLTSAVEYLHGHWILHRDLKTSNLLMNNQGQMKIADFGMARHYGDPPPKLTQLVVTLWYRSPELLLGAEEYGPEVDMWSIGCIFGELLLKDPLLQGKNEVDQLSKVLELCGVPTDESWPGFRRLPHARSLRLPRNSAKTGSIIRAKFPFLTTSGSDLLKSLLALNPEMRPSASDVLAHPYFEEKPRPKPANLFPTFPSKAGQEKRRKFATPDAPKRLDPLRKREGIDFSSIFTDREEEQVGGGFRLKLV